VLDEECAPPERHEGGRLIHSQLRPAHLPTIITASINSNPPRTSIANQLASFRRGRLSPYTTFSLGTLMPASRLAPCLDPAGRLGCGCVPACEVQEKRVSNQTLFKRTHERGASASSRHCCLCRKACALPGDKRCLSIWRGRPHHLGGLVEARAGCILARGLGSKVLRGCVV